MKRIQIALFFGLIFFSLLQPSLAVQEEKKWGYTRFPLLKKGTKFNYPNQIEVNGERLEIKLSPKSGTHLKIGIDQLYVSKNYKKKILIKQDVGLSDKSLIGNWKTLKSGSVYHFKHQNKLVAVYVEGYQELALKEIEKNFRKIKDKKISQKNNFLSLFIECANAETGTSGWTEDYNWQGTGADISVNVVGDSPSPSNSKDKTTEDDTAESMASCLLRTTGSSLSDMTTAAGDKLQAAGEAIIDGGYSLFTDPIGSARATGNFLYGVGETAVVGAYNGGAAVYNAGSAVVNYCLESCLDGEKMWNDAGDAVDAIYQVGAQLATRISSSVEGFYELSPAVKSRLICEIGGQMIAQFGVAAVLTFAGGSVVAAPRIALMLNNLEDKIRKGISALKFLSSSTVNDSIKQGLVTDFMRGNINEKEMLTALKATPANTNGPMEMKLVASEDPVNDFSFASPTSLGQMSLDRIEDLYAGQQIQVKSVSGGNTYSGELIEFVNTDKGVMMVYKDKNGKQDMILASRLDLSSWKGTPNNFTETNSGKLNPTPGTQLGSQITDFKTKTGLDLELRKGSKSMKEDFLINYETNTVTLNPSLKTNPDKLEKLLKTDIPKRLSVDRQARASAKSYGLNINSKGEIEVVNSTSTLGKMVAGMKKNFGTVITVGEEGLDSSRGVSFVDQNRISLNPELFLPGNETELMGVLRHEIKHNTNDRGLIKYPLLAGSKPSAAALSYSAKKIYIIPKNELATVMLQRAGVYSDYAKSGFRTDEYDARLTQYTKSSGASGTKKDSSKLFLKSQNGWMYQIIEQNLTPNVVSYQGGLTNVTYTVKFNGAEMNITIPLQGAIESTEQADRIAELVIQKRITDTMKLP